MDAVPKLILAGMLLAIVVYGQNNCPSGKDNIKKTCEYGCACGCGNNNVTFAACVAACELRIGGPLGCSALAAGEDLPNQQCALTSYNRNAVCARICDCCDIPAEQCSCANALASAVFGTTCALT